MPRPVSIVLTATGCPGASTLIRMLKANGERMLHVHGTDSRHDAIGRFLCDSFETVPWGTEDGYIEGLLRVVREQRPDILFVQSSLEVGPVSRSRTEFEALGARVLVAHPRAVELCTDKAAMHAALSHTTVRQPRMLLPGDLEEFVAGAHALGYPATPVCFKPPVGKGSRGFRVLRADVDRARIILHERPNDTTMTLSEFVNVFRTADPFPRLMLMEYVEGGEFTVDALVERGRMLACQAKTREAIDTGLAMSFRTVERADLVAAAATVCACLDLDWFANVQFKGDALLEVNPRVSTFVYQDDFNLPYLGIKYALGEIGASELSEAQRLVRPSRHTVRYYDQVFWDAPES